MEPPGTDGAALLRNGFADGLDLGKNFSMWQGAVTGGLQDWAVKAGASWEHYVSTFMKNVTYGQLVEGLDKFYDDFRNRSILVNDAVWLVLNQISGTPEEQVQKMIESFKRYSGR